MCLFAAGTCKACLSLFLVVYCGMDVVAVAASTVFATLMSSSLLLYLMKNTKSAIHISFHDMKVDWGILRQILSIGTPAGVQGAVVDEFDLDRRQNSQPLADLVEDAHGRVFRNGLTVQRVNTPVVM